MTTFVEKRVWLSLDQAQRLRELAKQHQTSEEQIITQAFDMLLSSTFSLDALVQHAEDDVHRASEDDFGRYLQSIGLLATNPLNAIKTQEDRTPIAIKGKPLSETVIEERR